jgi:hypothetical protein
MNRRSAPQINVLLDRRFHSRQVDCHQFWHAPRLEDVGTLTLERWMLEVDPPFEAFAAAGFERNAGIRGLPTREIGEGAHRWRRVIYAASDQAIWDAGRGEIHPGRSVRFDNDTGVFQAGLRADARVYCLLSRR